MTDEVPAKKRARFTRIPMQERPASVRRNDWNEVPLGYTAEEARSEADRCLQCKKPKCVEDCPVSIDIPGFLSRLAGNDFAGAARLIKEANSLPAVCGRVCPQEEQCEKRCTLGVKGHSVSIGNLERFAADFERAQGPAGVPPPVPKNGKRVAVVGSGPAGLTVAAELAKTGFTVTIFEAFHQPGGVLVYGIPEFRLPKEIVAIEIDYVCRLGVKIETNFVIGKTATIDDLLTEEGFDAVFVGSGAGLPLFLGIPGENSIGVYSANEYLTRANLMKAFLDSSDTPLLRGRRVVVVGGGNVAMDAARSALRLGATESILVYRRGREELPARRSEIHHAEEEGIQFHLLTNPIEVLADEKGVVRGLKCVKMALGEKDASGRARPVPVPGSEFELACDIVIPALGNKPNPLVQENVEGLQVSKWGTIVAGAADGRTTKKWVYAGGDVVTGAATVILAMNAGKLAAKSITEDLLGAPAA